MSTARTPMVMRRKKPMMNRKMLARHNSQRLISMPITPLPAIPDNRSRPACKSATDLPTPRRQGKSHS